MLTPGTDRLRLLFEWLEDQAELARWFQHKTIVRRGERWPAMRPDEDLRLYEGLRPWEFGVAAKSVERLLGLVQKEVLGYLSTQETGCTLAAAFEAAVAQPGLGR